MPDHTKLRAFELADEAAMLVYRVTIVLAVPQPKIIQENHRNTEVRRHGIISLELKIKRVMN